MSENIPSLEKIPERVYFRFSLDSEIKRVAYTIEKYTWYKGEGYTPIIPEKLKLKLEENKSVTQEEIEQAV
jgi:hypothetical protein